MGAGITNPVALPQALLETLFRWRQIHGQNYFFDQRQRPELYGMQNANNSDSDLRGHRHLCD